MTELPEAVGAGHRDRGGEPGAERRIEQVTLAVGQMDEVTSRTRRPGRRGRCGSREPRRAVAQPGRAVRDVPARRWRAPSARMPRSFRQRGAAAGASGAPVGATCRSCRKMKRASGAANEVDDEWEEFLAPAMSENPFRRRLPGPSAVSVLRAAATIAGRPWYGPPCRPWHARP